MRIGKSFRRKFAAFALTLAFEQAGPLIFPIWMRPCCNGSNARACATSFLAAASGSESDSC
jgi:hypothetical protein